MEYRDGEDTVVFEELKIRRKDGRTPYALAVKRAGDVSFPVLSHPLFLRGGKPEEDAPETVRSFYTTRFGGVSPAPYASMNLSSSRGDERKNVLVNFGRVAQALGTVPERMVLTCQIHGTKILRVDESHAGCGVTRDRPWDDVDGLITNVRGLALCTFFADCVPLQFYDPVRRAIGACHSGWRGSVGRIGAKCLAAMGEAFDTRPEDCLVSIGPSICRDCYEVSEDVAARFREEFPEHTAEILVDKGNGHSQLDLWAVCRITLEEAGVPRENISTPDICTLCNPRLMFSHRASEGVHGNFGGFIMLPETEEQGA